MIDVATVAARLRNAVASRRPIPPPSSEDSSFDLAAAYSVEHELARG
jgi:hypothetical protein